MFAALPQEEPSLKMNVNFFEWLRDSVRKTVLLGFSDAIEQLGAPNETDELSPTLAAVLQPEPSKPKRSRGGGRKRLGKSLKEMDAEPTKA